MFKIIGILLVVTAGISFGFSKAGKEQKTGTGDCPEADAVSASGRNPVWIYAAAGSCRGNRRRLRRNSGRF